MKIDRPVQSHHADFQRGGETLWTKVLSMWYTVTHKYCLCQVDILTLYTTQNKGTDQMIDPASVAQGVMTSVAAQHATGAIHDMTTTDDDKRATRRSEFWDFLQRLDEISEHLQSFINHQTRELDPDEWYYISLNVGAGGEFIVPHYTKQHFSLFIPGTVAVSINFRIPGLGLYTKSVGPGWVQVDLPERTELTSGDVAAHPVAVVFSDYARGMII